MVVSSPLVLPSVHRQLTGDLLGLLGEQVRLQEVLVSRRAAQPRLAEVHAAGEQEAAGARAHAALLEGPDVSAARQAPRAREQGVLLAEDARGGDLDDRRPEVLVRVHRADVPSHH